VKTRFFLAASYWTGTIRVGGSDFFKLNLFGSSELVKGEVLMQPRHSVFVLGLFLLLIAACPALATPWYVDDSHTSGTIDGTTWATSFRYLQDALDSSTSGDIIYVAQGIYQPDDDGDVTVGVDHATNSQTEYFKPKGGVEIYGGYVAYNSVSPPAGTRDPAVYVTFLTGDLSGNDSFTPMSPSSPPSFSNYGENSYHVLDLSDSDDLTIVDGFTITHGSAFGSGLDGTPTAQGGGIYVNRVLPATGAALIQNCVISECRATQTGGGIRVTTVSSSPPGLRFVDCIIRDNSGAGGGMRSASLTTLTNTTISNNYTTSSGGGVHHASGELILEGCHVTGNRAATGGGINRTLGNVTIRSTMVDANRATNSGGGIHWAGENGTTLVLVNSYVTNNQANGTTSTAGGGGLFVGEHSDTVEVVNTYFLGNQALNGSVGGGIFASAIKHFRITNSVFSLNSSANTDGGAIFATSIFDDGLGILDVRNCTLVANEATGSGYGGGIHYEEAAILNIENCILWNNEDADGAVSTSQIHAGVSPGAIDVNHSDVLGGFTGTNNINADPKFVNEPGGNYRLVYCSPAIDIGDTSALTDAEDPGDLDGNSNFSEPTPLDLDLHTRVIDNDYVGADDEVDMGAYENTTATACATLEGDVSADSAVNGLDVQDFTDCLMASSITCPCADMNGDGVIKTDDIPCFVSKLLSETTCVNCESLRGVPDCNGNGEDDANDIGWGTSQDCNENGIPDECDINTEDPDGNELVSDDENENGVPDECEPDCNANGHPDDKDIADEVSDDLNSNGIPDECEIDCNDNNVPDDWDISEETSADCNLDGIPDECQSDCNENGVPDDCDVNIEDPDGDEWVSPDCNENGYPDECDILVVPPFGSLDCNENGIPDECDIAAETSADTNENGIPDECEEEERGGAGNGRQNWGTETSAPGDEIDGNSSEAGRAAPEAPEAERWASFFDWCMTENFGEMTQRQRFDAIMAELEALNLPKAWPPIPVVASE
jgi:hypothetical protein